MRQRTELKAELEQCSYSVKEEETSPDGLWAELSMAGPRWNDINILLVFVSQGCITMYASIVIVTS